MCVFFQVEIEHNANKIRGIKETNGDLLAKRDFVGGNMDDYEDEK
ncbi:MAG: hypothetical protein ABII18_08420 [bacterium]